MYAGVINFVVGFWLSLQVQGDFKTPHISPELPA